MHKRPAPRLFADKTMDLGIPGFEGFRWQMPAPHVAAPFLQVLQELAREAGQAKTEEEALGVLERTHFVQCAIVGVLWAHPEINLDTPRSADVLAYGRAVGAELDDAGLDAVTLGREVGRRFTQTMQAAMQVYAAASQEAAQVEGFSGPARG